MRDACYYKILMICPNPVITAEVTPLLTRGLPLAPMHDVNMYPNRQQLMDLLRISDPKVCFLDFTGEKEAFVVLGEIRSLLPHLPVIVLLAGNNPTLVLQCVRQGASDFLIQPFTAEQVDACVEKVARTSPPPSTTGPGGKVIAVMPAKGAAGATTIACNLANQIKRLGANTVLLADMDPLTGTVSFLLKLKSAHSFLDVLNREDTLDGDLWKQLTISCQGVDVLLGPETLVDPNSDLSSAGPLVEFARRMYQAVVLDCDGVYGDWNLSLARLADEVLLVTTNELSSVQAAQRSRMYMDKQHVDMGKVKVVVNRYQKEAGLHSDFFQEAFGVEVFATIASDNKTVEKSLMGGKPIQSNSQIGKSLVRMAERLAPKDEKESKKRSKLGLLSSFFR